MGKQREVYINHTICPTGGACLHSCTLHTQQRRGCQPPSPLPSPSHSIQVRRSRACQPNPLPSPCLSLSLSTSNAEPDLIPRYDGDSNRRSPGKLRMHDINVDSHSADADSDSDSDCDCDVVRIRFRSNGHITFVHLQSSKWHYQFSLQELQVDPYTSTHTHTDKHTYIRVCLRS